MMRRRISISILFIVLLATAPSSYAWGPKGHRVVAQIAYDNLTRRARKQVDGVLGKEGMIYLSTWPDEIKSDTIYPQSFVWHFQDLDPEMTDSALVDALTVHYPEVGGEQFRAMDSLYVLLQHDKRNHDALVFYIHLSGDRFCPMHLGHKDDSGGNRVRMKWFGQGTNLHTVWDSKLIEYKGFSYSEYAHYLHNIYDARKKEVETMTDAQMLIYTYNITAQVYDYQTTWDGNTYYYAYRWMEPMEWQLYMAGIRLAQHLNALYK